MTVGKWQAGNAALSVVVLATRVIVWRSCVELLAARFASPSYRATSWWLPARSAEVAIVQEPPLVSGFLRDLILLSWLSGTRNSIATSERNEISQGQTG